MVRESFRLVVAGVAVAASLLLPRAAASETNTQPIAVPLIGESGVASPYPSVITVAAPGGPTQKGVPWVVLQHITYACPKDLAILLVHNDTDKYLLMSGANGCKSFTGTRVVIRSDRPALPETPPDWVSHGADLEIGPSNYGPQPVFPAPAPSGPYVNGLPPAAVTLNGTWKLYVMDTSPSYRCVLEVGWALEYGTKITPLLTSLDVSVPAGSPSQAGQASQYPIAIDLNHVETSFAVRRGRVEFSADAHGTRVHVAVTLH